MSDHSAPMNMLISCISLLGIWFLVFWLFRDYNVDSFRQKMFSLRDELFDFATEGNISFNHPAYGILRNSMNGMIRFGHKISLFNLMIIMFFRPDSYEIGDSFSKRWEENTKELKTDVRKKLIQYRQRMNLMVMRHMILRSPLLMLTIVIPIFGLVSLKLCMDNILIWFKRPLDSLDSAALIVGELT